MWSWHHKLLSWCSSLFSTSSIQTLQPMCNHQEVALPVLEQLLVEWLMAQPCYLLSRLPAAAAWDAAASRPRLARLCHSLCVSWWPRDRLQAAELPGAVAAGKDRMEPGWRPWRRVQLWHLILCTK